MVAKVTIWSVSRTTNYGYVRLRGPRIWTAVRQLKVSSDTKYGQVADNIVQGMRRVETSSASRTVLCLTQTGSQIVAPHSRASVVTQTQGLVEYSPLGSYPILIAVMNRYGHASPEWPPASSIE